MFYKRNAAESINQIHINHDTTLSPNDSDESGMKILPQCWQLIISYYMIMDRQNSLRSFVTKCYNI